MGIYITADIHGNPFSRLNTENFYEQKEFGKNKYENIVIQLGDCGIIWNRDEETKEEKYKLKWLEDKHFTFAFCDSNHDNVPRLDSYPIIEWNGGLVNQIRPNVLRLRRGEVYTIENKKFFCFGGATSHDISDGIIDYDEDGEWKKKAKKLDRQGKYMYRINGLSWWPEELPSQEEMDNGIKNLEKHDWKVDYIITHSPPASVLALIGHGIYDQDILTTYLEDVRSKTDFKRHYMGHMHINRQLNERDILLYEQIIRIV